MKSVEICAKTCDEAIAKALKELDATKDEVEIEVLEEGHRGILGFMSKEAKVRVSLKQTPSDRAEKFLEGLLKHFNIDVKTSVTEEKDTIKVEFSGKKVGALIGKHGSTLDALQYLTSLAVNKGDGDYKRVMMDAENYRLRREEALEKLAERMAKRVAATGKNVVMEPMIPNERRIIHAFLQNHKDVVTKSIGEGQHRRVVISIKA